MPKNEKVRLFRVDVCWFPVLDEERVRDVLNKGWTDEEIGRAVRQMLNHVAAAVFQTDLWLNRWSHRGTPPGTECLVHMLASKPWSGWRTSADGMWCSWRWSIRTKHTWRCCYDRCRSTDHMRELTVVPCLSTHCLSKSTHSQVEQICSDLWLWLPSKQTNGCWGDMFANWWRFLFNIWM